MTRKFTAAFILLMGLMVFNQPASANDGSATFGAGGLTFIANKAVKMVSEDLYLSKKLVRIIYRFKNTSAKRQKVTVAFPLPEINIEENISFHAEPRSAMNFVNFTTKVNGTLVATKIEIKAIYEGKDYSNLLKRLNVPFFHFTEASSKKLKALPQSTKARLKRLGLVYLLDNGRYVDPKWKLKVIHYWTQIFPAGKTMTIAHKYVPISGLGLFPAEALNPHTQKAYCMDQAFLNAAKGRLAKAKGNMMLSTDLDYILSTAKYWKGPIGSFHLTIDKGTPETLVSLCRSGLKKTGPTRFEFHAKNFVPKRDLKVFFLENIARN